MAESDAENQDMEAQDEAAEEAGPRLCPHCKAQLSDDADVCPRCGRDPDEPAGKKTFAIIVLILVAVLLGLGIWAVFFSG